jgi:hypothetical protein
MDPMTFIAFATSLTGCFIEALSADNFIIYDIATRSYDPPREHIDFRTNKCDLYIYGITLNIGDGAERYDVAVDISHTGLVWLNIKNGGRTNQTLNQGIRSWWEENLRAKNKPIIGQQVQSVRRR